MIVAKQAFIINGVGLNQYAESLQPFRHNDWGQRGMEINRQVRDKQRAGTSVNADGAVNAVKCLACTYSVFWALIWSCWAQIRWLYEVFIWQIKTQGVLHNTHGPTITLAKLQMRIKTNFGKLPMRQLAGDFSSGSNICNIF